MSTPELAFQFVSFALPALVFGLHGHHFMGIQQILQGIGPIPGLMLFPHSCHNRRKQIRIIIRRFRYYPASFRNIFEIELFSAKKSEAPHLMASKHSFMMRPISYSISTTP